MKKLPERDEVQLPFWRHSSQIAVGVEQITFLEGRIEVLFGEKRIITRLFWSF